MAHIRRDLTSFCAGHRVSFFRQVFVSPVAFRLGFGMLASAEEYPPFTGDLVFHRQKIRTGMGAIAKRLSFRFAAATPEIFFARLDIHRERFLGRDLRFAHVDLLILARNVRKGTMYRDIPRSVNQKYVCACNSMADFVGVAGLFEWDFILTR
jgi:hypothetical protein